MAVRNQTRAHSESEMAFPSTREEAVASPSMKGQCGRDLRAELERAQARLAELEATMNAIYSGEVDALAVGGPQGSRIFTLQNPEEPYRILAERMNEGVATLSAEGTILFCNRRLAKMAELPAERLLGTPFVSRLCDQERAAFAGLVQMALQHDVRSEGHLLQEKGSVLPVQISLSRILLAESLQGICLVATDLSERARAEEELRLSRERQLRLKDELLSHVSHELRTPLASIHQFTSILLDGLSGPLSGEQNGILEIILKSANQLRTMIDDLLETARIEAGKAKLARSCVVLPDAVQEAIEMLRAAAAEKAIDLQRKGQDEPLVYADPRRVLQILLNLIGNALKFTPAGGHVEVTYGIAPGDTGYAIVAVKDDGCGISEPVQARVFERLYQEECSADHGHEGLGLGLAICRELVTSHKGKIWVESRPGAGSTFSFTLPTYSLEKILSPALTENGTLRRAVSLILVRAVPKPTAAAIEQWSRTRRKLHELLCRCSLPDKDVVLPSVRAQPAGETFAVLAGTDARGAEVLVQRIRQQMKRCQELSENCVTQVSCQVVRATQGVEVLSNRSVEALAGEIARAVSQAMNMRSRGDEQT
jgi:PAS domain S-box-containing protein